MQDAFATALARWPAEGVPPAPAGWLITTARNRAIDRLRRERSRDARHAAAMELLAGEAESGDDAVQDDRLRMIFTCCHPALATEAQLALTLRLLGGLSTAEIARAFLVSEPTLAQRIARAKAKIRAAGIPYRVPEAQDLPARLRSVLAVIYLLFNEGYRASFGDALIRDELCDVAIRLARLLVELLPGESEALGLLALLLLIDARRAARTDGQGAFVRLGEQDRALWDRARIAEGQMLLRECLKRGQPGPYQLQAAINAVHGDALRAQETDWRQIVAIYDQLMAMTPSPVVALNRAVAVGEVEGAQRALELVEGLELQAYHLWHAVRADLLRRAGRDADAAEAYIEAIARCENAKEKEFLERRYREIAKN